MDPPGFEPGASRTPSGRSTAELRARKFYGEERFINGISRVKGEVAEFLNPSQAMMIGTGPGGVVRPACGPVEPVTRVQIPAGASRVTPATFYIRKGMVSYREVVYMVEFLRRIANGIKRVFSRRSFDHHYSKLADHISYLVSNVKREYVPIRSSELEQIDHEQHSSFFAKEELAAETWEKAILPTSAVGMAGLIGSIFFPALLFPSIAVLAGGSAAAALKSLIHSRRAEKHYISVVRKLFGTEEGRQILREKGLEEHEIDLAYILHFMNRVYYNTPETRKLWRWIKETLAGKPENRKYLKDLANHVHELFEEYERSGAFTRMLSRRFADRFEAKLKEIQKELSRKQRSLSAG